jgi:hypothetical protein
MNIPEIRESIKTLDDAVELIKRLKSLKIELADISGMARSVHDDKFIPEVLKLKMLHIAEYCEFLNQLSESESNSDSFSYQMAHNQVEIK